MRLKSAVRDKSSPARRRISIEFTFIGCVVLQFWLCSSFHRHVLQEVAVTADLEEAFIRSTNDNGNGVVSSTVANLSSEAKPLGQKMTERLQKAEPPWPLPPNTPGAHIHIGKAGGSTIATQLRNGCHSWVAKPCKQFEHIRNETRISQLTTYYHTPDFPKSTCRTQQYQFYVVHMRDPLARFRSIFTAYHYDNASHRRRKDRHNLRGKDSREHQKTFSKCFPSLEDFAAMTAASAGATSNATAPLTNDAYNCSMIPEAIFQYQEKFSAHWYWNHDTVWRNVLKANPFFDRAIVLSLRTEHLWGDWISANHYLGQSEVMLPSNMTQERAYGHLNVPVSTHLSETGRRTLCRALAPDYEAYLALLRRAVNLNETQKMDSLMVSQTSCPWLGLTL
jgi:hypothetical protein